jgi:hypothetical protein
MTRKKHRHFVFYEVFVFYNSRLELCSHGFLWETDSLQAQNDKLFCAMKKSIRD